jgi:hypothetical protein
MYLNRIEELFPATSNLLFLGKIKKGFITYISRSCYSRLFFLRQENNSIKKDKSKKFDLSSFVPLNRL